MIILFIIWIILCILITNEGNERKISAVGAFFIIFFLSPLVGIIVVSLSAKKTYLIFVNFEGTEQQLEFGKININVPYIQKSPTTGAYKVYKKTGNHEWEFLRDFNGYLEAKEYLISQSNK